jgi:phosphatidylglycerophosphatase A
MKPNSEMPGAGAEKIVKGKKPRVALALATVFGIGYAPKAPGTCGSVVGVALSAVLLKLWPHMTFFQPLRGIGPALPFVAPAIAAFAVIAALGVWSANRVAVHSGVEDPQYVVIDEVSGQMITLLFGIATTISYRYQMEGFAGGFWWQGALNWKWLLLGFILFRVFDIWKPYPVRRLEKLPGGWGIMADDWMAGIYAAVVLRVVIHLGLI